MPRKTTASSVLRKEIAKHTFANVNTAEQMIRALIKAVGPQAFVIGLNNACAHGEAFHDADLYLGDDDKLLNGWFEGIAKLREVADAIETIN